MAQQLSTLRDINTGRQGPNHLMKAHYHLVKNYCISWWFVYIIFDEMPWYILKLFWPDLEFLIGHIFCPKVHFHTPSCDQKQPHSCHILLLLQWFILKQTTTSGAFWLFMHCWFCFCLFSPCFYPGCLPCLIPQRIHHIRFCVFWKNVGPDLFMYI